MHYPLGALIIMVVLGRVVYEAALNAVTGRNRK